MIPRAVAVLLVGLALGGGSAQAHDRLGIERVPRIAEGRFFIGRALDYGGAPTTSPNPSGPGSSSPSPASEASPSPLSSGAGVVILLVIGGAFLWLRGRALRR